MSASAAYWIASSSDHIIAHRSSIVGSIGALSMKLDLEELFKKIGADIGIVRSHALKAAGAGYHKLTDKQRESEQQFVKELARIFLNSVVTARGWNEEDIAKITGGKIYSGDQALELKLIDAIGTTKNAKEWFIEHTQLDKDIPVIKMSVQKKKRPYDHWLRGCLSQLGITQLIDDAKTYLSGLTQSFYMGM